MDAINADNLQTIVINWGNWMAEEISPPCLEKYLYYKKHMRCL